MADAGQGFSPSEAGRQRTFEGEGVYDQMVIPGTQRMEGNPLSSEGRRVYPVMAGEEDLDLDDYEMVGPEFFAQPKEPAFTVNVDKITVNAAGVRMLPDADYVKILLNQKEKKLVLKPCSELDIRGYRWARMKDGKRYASQRTGEPFVLIICQIMGWDPNNRYRIQGRKTCSKGEGVLVFDLTTFKCFPKPVKDENGKPAKRSAIPFGWNGTFGPKYGEDKRSLAVNTFDGYTVLTVKGETLNAGEDAEDNGPDPHIGPANDSVPGNALVTARAGTVLSAGETVTEKEGQRSEGQAYRETGQENTSKENTMPETPAAGERQPERNPT